MPDQAKLYAYFIGSVDHPDVKSPYKIIIDCRFDPGKGWTFAWDEKTEVATEKRQLTSYSAKLTDAVHDVLTTGPFPVHSWVISDDPNKQNSKEWLDIQSTIDHTKQLNNQISNQNSNTFDKYRTVAIVISGIFAILAISKFFKKEK